MKSERVFYLPATQCPRAASAWVRLPAFARALLLNLLVAVGISVDAGEPVSLLIDNFNANTANTFDLNVDLARQFGAAAPISYTMAFGPTQCCGHQLQNVNAPDQLLLADFIFSTSSPNYDFSESNAVGGLRITFDVDPLPALYGSTDLTLWGCINLGMAQPDQLTVVNGNATHFGVLFRANGHLQAFDGSTIVSPALEPVYTAAPGGMHHIELRISDPDGNAFDGNGDTLIEVFADYSIAPVFTFNKAGGYARNYINLQGFHRAHFDNLIVTRINAERIPVIDQQPQQQFIALGAPAEFTVWASGIGPLSYQWRRNGVNIPGATGQTLVLSPTTVADAGTYSVVVANNFGSVLSDSALLLFNNVDDFPPALSDGFETRGDLGANPTRLLRGNTCDASREFAEPIHAARVGGKSVWYRWTAAADGIAVFSTRGSTFDTLLAVYTGGFLSRLTRIASDDDSGGFATSEVRFNAIAGQEYAIVIDGKAGACGPFYLSWNLEITSERVPVIATQPQSRTVQFGDSYTFSVKVPGDNTYQWFFNGQPMVGATGDSLPVQSIQLDDLGAYRVRVTAAGSGRFVDSRTAVLEIGPLPDVQSLTKPEDLPVGPNAGGGGVGGGIALEFQPASDFTTAPRIPIPRGGVGQLVWNNVQGSTTFLLCGVRPTATRWILLFSELDGYLVVHTQGSRNSAGQPIKTMLSVFRQDVTGLPIYQPSIDCGVTNDPSGIYGVVRFFARANSSYWVAADGVNTNGTIQVNWIHCPWPLTMQPSESITAALGQSVNVGVNLSWNPSPDVTEPLSLFSWEHSQQRFVTNQPVRKLASVQASDAGLYSVTVSNVVMTTNLTATLTVDPTLVVLRQSTFDAMGDDGWKTSNNRPTDFRILSTPDIHAGYLSRNETTTNWIAPAKYLGNQSAAAGGQLQFYLRSPAVAVFLRGDGLSLELRTNSTAVPLGDWVRYLLPLTPGPWLINGRPATPMELLRVLGHLDRIEIATGFPGSTIGGDLDDVVWIGPAFNGAPYLVARPVAGNRVQIEWPLAATGFGLETTTIFNQSGLWTVAPLPYGTNFPYLFVLTTNSGHNTFYRLRKP